MNNAERGAPEVERTQQDYARMLVWFVRVALVTLFVGFVLYAAGVVPSRVEIAEVPEHWHLSASEYARETGGRQGWSWITELDEGRTLAFAALVFFPAGTIVLVLAAVVLYLRARVPVYALITFLEAVVLVIAASGLLVR